MEEIKLSGKFIRHGESAYKGIAQDLASENPQKSFDRNQQPSQDLTEKGIAQVREAAKKILAELDPSQTTLHIWSSDESRAINTCQIFTEEATTQGFTVSPSSTKRKGAYWLDTEPISRTDVLSINTPNILLSTIFMPSNAFSCSLEMLQTPDRPDEETQKLYDKILEIRSLIDNENQEAVAWGEKVNWGSNYAKYGDRVHDILPDVEGPEQVYRRKFIKGVLLLQRKSLESSSRDRLVLFGHENILLHFLKTQFDKEHFGNCEILEFCVDSENLEIKLENGITKIIPTASLNTK